MEELILKGIETAFLAAMLDVPVLYGIPDSQPDMQQEGIHGSMAVTHRSLQDKGVLITDSDGETIEPACLSLLDTVFHCEYYASAVSQTGEEQRAVYLYRREDRLVVMELQGENCVFRPTNKDKLPEILWQIVDWSRLSSAMPVNHEELPEKVFSRAKEMQTEKAVAYLKEAGLSIPMAELAADAFSHRTVFAVFLFLNTRGRADAVQHVMFLGDNRGVVKLGFFVKENLDYVALEACDPDHIRRCIEQKACWFLGEDCTE